MDAAATREPFDRWFWWWWAGSVALVYALQGVPTLVSRFPLHNMWTDPEWLVAIVAYAITLATMTLVLRRRLRHHLSAVVWGSGAATLLYLLAAHAMLAITAHLSAETLLSGLPVAVLFGFLFGGHGWIAFLVPVLTAIAVRRRKASGRYPARAGY